ncbi:MAG TPA: TIGR01777 family oxidoreductase [Chitinophagaceae bacterium]|nr:TIGR01777 family oxidoreductase [Chitinophagaceae bacterium]
METILITGGTGLIGSALTRALLEKSYSVIVLSRRPRSTTTAGLRYAAWDPDRGKVDYHAIGSADHIIHLAGAPVAGKRWTKKRKEEIISSRVQTGSLIAAALRETSQHTRSVISISGIGYYGADNEKSVTGEGFVESDPPSMDFLGQTCIEWEESLKPVGELNIRRVVLRTGIVLSNKGGALREFLRPLRFGLAAIPGSGKQIVSWIHVRDLARLFLFAIENPLLSGAYNAVAPLPASMKDLVLEMAGARRKFYFPMRVPAPFLRLALGEMAVEVLKSAKVSSGRIRKAGFAFHFPELRAAMQDLFSP